MPHCPDVRQKETKCEIYFPFKPQDCGDRRRQRIGLAITEALAERGASVTIMDRDAARLEAVVTRLNGAGHAARGQIFDASSPQSVKEAFEQAAKFHGGLDVVFANAGIGEKAAALSARDGKPNPPGEITNYEFDSWKETLGVNLDGPFLTIKEAARLMKPHMRGHIILTSSFMPLVTLSNVDLAYSVSKAAVVYLTRIAALELARYNIQVNAIAPGMFATNIFWRQAQRSECHEYGGAARAAGPGCRAG